MDRKGAGRKSRGARAQRQVTKKQHYVSKTLLSRFSQDPEQENQLVGYFDLIRRVPLPDRPPSAIGFEWYYIKYDIQRMEALWGSVEDPMRPVFQAIEDDRLPDLEGHRESITDFMALHFARSLEALRIHRDTFQTAAAKARADIPLQRRLAELKYGLDMSSAPSVLNEMAEAVLEPIRAEDDKGTIFQEWVEEVFAKTRRYLSACSLSIQVAQNGSEFLISDSAVTGITNPGADPRKRPPLLDARALLLPLGPKVTAMAYPTAPLEPGFSVDPATPESVELMNLTQIAQAHRKAYYRPGSGHEDTVRRCLDRLSS